MYVTTLYWFLIIVGSCQIFIIDSTQIETTLRSSAYKPISSSFNSLSTMRDNLHQSSSGTWRCQCWNVTTRTSDLDTDCLCYGVGLQFVPTQLYGNINKLSITDAGIQVIEGQAFQSYKHSIHDIVLSNLNSLVTIEAGAFKNLFMLRSLYISHCPMLKQLDGLFNGVTTDSFRSLRILNTGLEKVPDLQPLYHMEKIVQMIDLERNQIQEIPSNSLRIKAEQVVLNYNKIKSIQGFVFNSSEIGRLSFKGNSDLIHLDHNAFSGLVHIRELDLSNTKIVHLPTEGLRTLEVLRIQDTPTLTVIPSLYNFKHLKEAWLTHSFHCCAFKYPERHDPTKHANYQAYVDYIQENCKTHSEKSPSLVRKLRSSIAPSIMLRDNFYTDEVWSSSIVTDNEFQADQIFDSSGISNETIEINNGEHEEHMGIFHDTIPVASNYNSIICGNLSIRFDVKCFPEPDALNPCEDIMGSYWLRISVWLVLVTAIFGNLAVIIVLFSSCSDLSVPKFLMCHLAIADLCMGLYLLMLAVMDIHSMEYYFNFAFDWQFGWGCKTAGFLTIFASQLSIYTLSVVTLERWFAIAHAIHLNRRIKLSMAARIMVFGWAYSILMGALPLFGVSNYSATSICLPLKRETIDDLIYIITLLTVTGLAFILIMVCYTQIYFSLDTGARPAGHHGPNEMTVARKMALLVFTDFACWAPIAFFSLTALAGFPLIDVTRSKILLVFFYPLNSCANPYLYALLTTQYKRDLFALFSRCGCCRKRAHQYKLAYSIPTTNNSNPLPLTARSSIPCSTNNDSTARKFSKATVNEIYV